MGIFLRLWILQQKLNSTNMHPLSSGKCPILRHKARPLTNIWRNQNQEIDHRKSKGDCIICNDNSTLLIHQFIHQEVSKAWAFGVHTWTDATCLYRDEDWTQLFLPFSWRPIYSLKCIHCCWTITAPRSIGETLYHAPIAMLRHWDMIGTEDAPGEFDNASIPLVCTSLDSYHQPLTSFNKNAR